MKDIKIIILDFDGTIGNSSNYIIQTMMATFEKMNMKLPSREACAKTIGLPLAKCFSHAYELDNFPLMSDEVAEMCAQTYHGIFAENKRPGIVPPYPHCIDTLRKLYANGMILTLASSRNHSSLQEFVDEYEINDIISLVLGADDVEHAKPHSEPVDKTLAHFGLNPQQALVVGDTHFDILMGRNAGATTCGVSYGNGSREELTEAGADFIIDDFAELLS